ncbi:MAG TPA: tetratricopeptide repeat protein [Saprospiraceae bacterium]|nr:tetratricopeptide repeat protein [Saprospiraceae bacterium]HNM25770.1 tetratricopeptide repeat protein [Saprospiraceae bacterium]
MSKRLQLLLNLLETNPADSFALFATAKEYEGMGEAGQALLFYERLRQSDASYVGLYYHLGKLYERLGNPDAALDAYRAGCASARQAGDQHAYNELMGARLNLDHPNDEEI